jgi:hypothetical protein
VLRLGYLYTYLSEWDPRYRIFFFHSLLFLLPLPQVEPRNARNIESIYHGSMEHTTDGHGKMGGKADNDTMSGTVKYVKYRTIGIIEE